MFGTLHFAIGVLATWRVSHLLSREDGPWALCARLRQATQDNFIGTLLSCPYCVSVWAALPVGWWLWQGSPGSAPVDLVMMWWGTSGGACVIERFAPPLLIFEPLDVPSSKQGD
jgi:Protein of unknown function (DUF1360)